jgi:hypothetical protein
MPEPVPIAEATSIWERAAAKAEAFEANLRAEGKPVPGDAAEPEAEAAETTETPAADAKPEPEKPKAKADAKKPEAAPASDDKRAQFDALAKELGYTVDANAVTVNERVKWRNERQRDKQKAAERDRAFEARVAQTEKNLESKFGRGAMAAEAWDKGDFDGLATALAGEKTSWKDLQGKAGKLLLSPEHKRIRELEDREQARERQAQQEQQAAAEQRQRAEQAQARQQWHANLSQEMAASENQQLKALAKLPMFVSAIMDIQGEAYQRGEELPTPEQALSRSYGGSPLIDNARNLWQSLSQAFGSPAPSSQEAANAAGNRSAEDSARTAKRAKTASRSGATEVSEKTKAFDIRYWAKQMAEADDR